MDIPINIRKIMDAAIEIKKLVSSQVLPAPDRRKLHPRSVTVCQK